MFDCVSYYFIFLTDLFYSTSLYFYFIYLHKVYAWIVNSFQSFCLIFLSFRDQHTLSFKQISMYNYKRQFKLTMGWVFKSEIQIITLTQTILIILQTFLYACLELFTFVFYHTKIDHCTFWSFCTYTIYGISTLIINILPLCSNWPQISHFLHKKLADMIVPRGLQGYLVSSNAETLKTTKQTNHTIYQAIWCNLLQTHKQCTYGYIRCLVPKLSFALNIPFPRTKMLKEKILLLLSFRKKEEYCIIIQNCLI